MAGVLWFLVGHLCVRPSFCITFPDNNLSKHQQIFTKFGMFIDHAHILVSGQ